MQPSPIFFEGTTPAPENDFRQLCTFLIAELQRFELARKFIMTIRESATSFQTWQRKNQGLKFKSSQESIETENLTIVTSLPLDFQSLNTVQGRVNKN